MKRRELMKYTLAAAAPATLLGTATLAGASASHSPKEAGAVPDAHLTAALSVPAGGEIRVAFFISPGAEVVDFAGPWGVFEYVMIGDDHHSPFKLYTAAASNDPVKVTGGMTVVPNYTFADAPTPDIVVVPATDIDKLTGVSKHRLDVPREQHGLRQKTGEHRSAPTRLISRAPRQATGSPWLPGPRHFTTMVPTIRG